ncbi:MAG: response regulator [Desulfobulbaceae bacterium]|nr:response regulator [Desulfobulbaceae bacterium]
MKRHTFGIRNKLISIFVFIKVVPLIALAWFSWNSISDLADKTQHHYQVAIEESKVVTKQVVDLSTENSIRALDLKARESIERLSTDTARRVADFLYNRDHDIALAALIDPNAKTYKQFLSTLNRPITTHGAMAMDGKGQTWQFIETKDTTISSSPTTSAQNKDNEKNFHARGPESTDNLVSRPLYLEMTFLDLEGKEKIKITTSDLVTAELQDVSKKDNTYCQAETYYQYLTKLRPNEIYVSEVIGASVKTHMIGPYTRIRAEEMGIDFAPELSGYAGRENPVGKRFQGLVRWATPIIKEGEKIGYVTLALDHSHIMEFTDHIVPTDQRYLDISDGNTGNYAFMWDYKSRNISHPRDYFIVGYDSNTGEQELPWLETGDYSAWQKSTLPPADFLKSLPLFHQQTLEKKPAKGQIESGLVALDCRYLNFAPQCNGWNNLTQDGGSGSFLIFWSGLWKLNTAAAIPYFTGMYKDSSRGFGYVTIGANVNEFHRTAMETANTIAGIEKEHLTNLDEQSTRNREILIQAVTNTVSDLTCYTGIMIIIVIFIALWIASLLTGRILQIIKSLNRFQQGEMDHRLEIHSGDEAEDLAISFNAMADNIQQSITKIQNARELAEETNVLLENEVKERHNAEIELAEHRDNLEKLVLVRTQELGQEIGERKLAEESRNEFEARLHRAEKMEAIGTLAGGVAHDLNNILSGIVSYPEMLLMDMPKEHRLYKPLKIIKSSGDKAVVIVQDLLTMARRGVANQQLLNLDNLIEDLLKSPECRSIFNNHPNVTFRTHLNAKLVSMNGSKVHLQKSILNLIANAAESITSTGIIAIKTSNHYVDTVFKSYDHVQEGEYIKLTIEDNGIGIAPENLKRIFEPFFTTKTMGRSGSGLGMAVVWGTVKDHGGYIDMTSKLLQGSTFDLYFPLLREATELESKDINLDDLKAKGESVLVIDDIKEQREIASMMLTRLGYKVETVNSGEKAIDYLRYNTVDILLLDMIMTPGIDGLETYRQIIKMHSQQKAVIVSGFSESEKVLEAQKLGTGSYLKKPYNLIEIATILRAEFNKL